MRKTFAILAASGLALGLPACDVDQTEAGDAPAVEVEGGELPEYDVEPANVDVSTGTTTVEVPTADVDVSVPDAEGEPATGSTE